MISLHSIKLCRFRGKEGDVRVGLVDSDSTIIDLTSAGIREMFPSLEDERLLRAIRDLPLDSLPRLDFLSDVQLLPPVEKQEVWAAGVTYLRSKRARMEESDFSATAYDRIYEA